MTDGGDSVYERVVSDIGGEMDVGKRVGRDVDREMDMHIYGGKSTLCPRAVGTMYCD